MSTIFQNPSSDFSKESIKKALQDEHIDNERAVELNELASQVAQQFAAGSISPHVVSGITRLTEFLAIMGAGALAFIIQIMPETGFVSWHVGASVLVALVYAGLLQGFDGYQIGTLRTGINQLSKAAVGFALSLMVLVLAAYLFDVIEAGTRQWLTHWFAYGLGFIAVFRLIAMVAMRKLSAEGRLERRAVIVGGGTLAADLIHSLEGQSDTDIRICGIFDDRSGDRSPPVVAGYPKLGTVPELVEFARKARINMLIVALPLTAEKRVVQLLKRLWVLPVDIRLSAHTNKLNFRTRSYSYEGSVPFLDVFENPIADWDSIMKRGFDLFFAATALILLSPLMVATAIAVKLDSRGPILFRQKRHGFNNEIIEVLKFRSLHHEMADHNCSKAVTRNDNRVTRVGRFIRKTSIDELPQLFNVLAGTLSLVGPRPHVVDAQTGNRLWNDVVDSYFARHKVKPGVTGWAQVNGWRGEIDADDKIKQRVNHDLYYIENWSLLFDLYILAITPFKILNTENAY